jgi:hypothetical protein
VNRARASCARLAAIMLAAALLWFPPRDARAYFEHVVLSARSASLGGAFVALGDDPSTVVDNPAGLSGIPTLSFLTTYDRPYGVDAINEGYIASVVPLSGLSAGISWFHRGVSGALSEDMVTLALARDLKRTSEDASLSIGATVDLARVAVSGGDAASQVTFGAAVLLRPFAFIGLGYSIRNVTEPSFDLIEGGGDTELSRAQAVGLSYYWQQRLLATVESRQDQAGEWRARGGLELRIENHILLRGGLDRDHATAGIGISARGLTADLAMASHDELGATYLFTLRYARPKPAAGY